jgi:uncharacterized phage protein gp47/JayE
VSEITETGIILDNFDDVKEKLADDFRAIWGEGANLDPSARLGQLLNILSERVADQNDLIMAVVAAQNPNGATGVWLEQIVQLNGIRRKEPVFSTVAVTLTAGTANASILSGDTVDDPAVGEPFAIDEDVVIPSGTSVTVSATAVNPGAIEAPAGTLTRILTPRFGWASSTNAADASVGSLEETPADLRIRRDAASRRTGTSSVPTIFTALSDIAEVNRVRVLENTTGVTDSNGIPAKSIWAIVSGGADATIAETLFKTRGAGIYTHGTTAYTYSDPITGADWVVRWSRPTNVPISVAVRTVKGTTYPGDGDTQIKNNIVAFFAGTFTLAGSPVAGFGLGDSVIASRLFSPANAVSGHDVQAIWISDSGPPFESDPITLTPDQLATVDPDDITIVAV